MARQSWNEIDKIFQECVELQKHKNDEKLKGQLEIPGDLSECNARHMQLTRVTAW